MLTFRHFQDIYHHAYRDYLPVDPTDPILALHSRAPRGSAVTTTIPNAPMPDAEVAASLDGVRAAERHAVEARLLRDDAIRQAKEAGGQPAVQNADGSWTISYLIKVSNPDLFVPVYYELTDTPPPAPAGTTITDWKVTSPGASDWPTGSNVIARNELLAGTSHSFTVTAKLTLDAGATPVPNACGEGTDTGIAVINSATVTNKVGTDTDDGCTSVNPKPVKITKTFTSANQNLNGTWTVLYEIKVEGPSSGTTPYTLTDTPQFSPNVTFTSLSWSGQTTGGPTGTVPATLATNLPISAGQTHTYNVTALASVNVPVGQTLPACTAQSGPFYNVATIVFPGGSASDNDCGVPAKPTVTKTVASVSPAGVNQWTLSYNVAVTNNTGSSLAYTLTDTPAALPTGASGGSWAATGPTVVGGGSGTLTEGWTGTGGNTQLATGFVPNGASHTYVVTRTVTLAADLNPANLKCSNSPDGKGFWNTASVTNGVGGNDSSICAEITPPTLTIAKSDATVSQGANGVWTLVYDITVTNGTAVDASYALKDTPTFDPFFTVAPVAEPWSKGGVSQAANPSGTVAAGSSVTWTYTVQATASGAGPAPVSATTCSSDGEGGGSGGFYNIATVTFPGGTDIDDGCGEPAKPTVTKTGQQATQNTTTGEWTLSYKVVVSNTSTIPLWYDVADTAAALPTGVTGGAWAATGPEMNAQLGTADRNEAWNGSGQLATGTLPVGAVHTYTITRVVKVAADTPDAALECKQSPTEGGGVWNSATVTNKVGGNDSRDCITIDRPDVTIAKTVTKTEQLATGLWRITYDVVVTNTSTDQAAVYTLKDTLHFGGDIDVDTASWAHSSGSPEGVFTATAPQTATMVTDRVLAPSGSETFKVTVDAVVNTDAWDKETGTVTCEPRGSLEAGGFLNVATVTASGTPKTADDCSTPELPTITKTAKSAAQDPSDPDSWLVSYELTVKAGKFDTFYTLKDVPGFASGITLGGGTAQRTDIAAQPVLPITSGATFPAAPVAISANGTHTWTVIWKATITSEVPGNAQQCGERPTSGKGFYNEAELLQGGKVVDNDDDCIPVLSQVYPTVTKTVKSTVQDPATGKWTITYDVVVKLAPKGELNPEGLAAKYNLKDTLDFGGEINIDSASWTGPTGTNTPPFAGDPPSAQLATGRTIAAGGTDTYTVTAVADVTSAAIEEQTTVCKSGRDGPEASGFLNRAVLTSGTRPAVEVDACSEPVFPTIEKVPGMTIDNGDGSFGLEYMITVTYPTPLQSPPPGTSYTLTDAPTLPAGVELDGTWSVTAADADTPAPGSPTWDGTGTWTIVSGAEFTPAAVADGKLTHTYLVNATVKVTGLEVEPSRCVDREAEGIVVTNVGTITSGAYVADDDACDVVHYDDVGIVKTSSIGVEGALEPGQEFDYVLTVTNHGSRPAVDVVVKDQLHSRLTATGIDLPAGWVNDNDPAFLDGENWLSVSTASLAVGATVEITVHVTLEPAALPPVEHSDSVPEPPDPLEILPNEACVAAELDQNPENNCDDIEIPVKEITAVVYTQCVADAPLLGWVVKKSSTLLGEDITFTWTPGAGTVPANVVMTHPGGTSSWVQDPIRWPGTEFTPSGISIDYPGWRPIVASDVVPGSLPNQYYFPGTATVMTPAEQAQNVFNGLILDPSEIDFGWREPTTVTFTVNPELTFDAVVYPVATEDCYVARHTEVQIEKTASVETTKAGQPFTYTLEVANVSDDSAADGVVVTDEIPSMLKVTDISWPGKGDASVFPNWQTCEVTGSSGGYGGLLTCELFGPLQPTTVDGPSAAPTITLSVTSKSSTTATTITNVAMVDYHTFGDPEDTGHDEDDAVVKLKGGELAFTGSDAGLLLGGALLAVLAGTGLVLGSRKRRQALKG